MCLAFVALLNRAARKYGNAVTIAFSFPSQSLPLPQNSYLVLIDLTYEILTL